MASEACRSRPDNHFVTLVIRSWVMWYEHATSCADSPMGVAAAHSPAGLLLLHTKGTN